MVKLQLVFLSLVTVSLAAYSAKHKSVGIHGIRDIGDQRIGTVVSRTSGLTGVRGIDRLVGADDLLVGSPGRIRSVGGTIIGRGGGFPDILKSVGGGRGIGRVNVVDGISDRRGVGRGVDVVDAISRTRGRHVGGHGSSAGIGGGCFRECYFDHECGVNRECLTLSDGCSTVCRRVVINKSYS